MKQVFELNLSADQYIKGLADISTSIRTLRAEQKELDLTTANGQQKFEQNAVAIKGLSEQYRFFQKEVANLGEKNNDLKTKTDAVNALMAKEATTINELNQQTAALNKVKKNLNIENENEKALIDQINKKIDDNTNKVKSNSSEVEKQKMNVGNYTNSIKDAFASINPLNGGLSGFISRSQEAGGTGKLFTQAMGGMVQGVWGLVKASLAFIATPIGAVITALALAVGLVVKVFKQFEPAIDAINSVLTPLKFLFESFIGVIQEVGTTIVKAFSNPLDTIKKFASTVTSVMKPIGDILIGIFTFDTKKINDGMQGMKDNAEKVRDAYKSVADKTGEAWEKGKKIAQLNIEIEEGEAKIAKKKAETNEKIKQQELLSKDQSKSMKERLAATEKAKELQKEQINFELELKDKEIERMKLQQSANHTGRDGLKELNELEAQRIEIAGQLTDIELKFTEQKNQAFNEQQQLQKQASEESKRQYEERIQREIKTSSDEITLFQAKEGEKKKTLSETLDYEKKLMDKRNSLNDLSYAYGKKTEQEYETEKLNILKTYNDAVFQATSENLTKELELWKSQNATKLADNKITSDAVLSGQIALQDTLYEKQKAVIDQTILDEQEKAIALQNLQNEHETAVQGIKDTYKQYQREQEATDYEIKMETLQLQSDSELLIKQNQYDRDKELLTQQLEDKKLTEEQYQQKLLNLNSQFEKDKTAISQRENDNRISLYSSAFGNIATIFGKNSAIGKAAGVAQATIDTYQAANKALATYPPPFSYIAAAASIATGIGNVKKIVATKTTYSRGGWLNGRSHAGGGIPMTIAGVGGYEAEGGEAIINKRSSALYRPILSAINQAGGGVAFAQGGLTTGSDRVTDAIFNQIDITSQLSKIKVVNVAEETAVLYNGILKVENRANV